MVVSQIQMMAHSVRRKYFMSDYSLDEAFSSIFKDKKISIDYQRQSRKIRRDEDGKYIITLPMDTSPLQNNHTIACELGHIFLGHPIDDTTEKHPTSDKVRMSREANLFAVELLMPQREFTQACVECGNDPSLLASKFSVLPQAAMVRMSILGMTPNLKKNIRDIEIETDTLS